MKILFLTFTALLLFSCGSLRRGSLTENVETKPKTDSTFEGLHSRDSEQGSKRDRLILDVHYNEWLGDREEVKTGWNSLGFNTNALFDFPLNKKSTISWATGLQFGRTSVQHNGLFFLVDSIQSSLLYPTTQLEFTRTSQRFIQSQFSIPLEIRFRGAPINSYRLTLGGTFGINVNTYEKWRDADKRFRNYNHPNKSLLRGGVYMRLGYQRWNLYASYTFTPLFIGANNSKLNTLQIGVSISIF